MLNVFATIRQLLSNVAKHVEEGTSERHPEPPVPVTKKPPRFKVVGGWLEGEGVVRATKWPRCSRSPRLEKGQPLGVIWHATATARGTGNTIFKAWHEYDPKRQASAHVILDYVKFPDGMKVVIYQNIPFTHAAWSAFGKIDGVRSSALIENEQPNSSCISIELTGVGRVAKKLDQKWRGWASGKGKGVGYGPAVPDDEVTIVRGQHFQMYPYDMMAAAVDVTQALMDAYPSLVGPAVTVISASVTLQKMAEQGVVWPTVRSVPRTQLTHHIIDPLRKDDPYATFDMSMIPK